MKIYSYINLFPVCRFEVVWWSRRTEPDVLFHPTCVSNIYSMWTRDTEWFSHKMESLWLGYKCSLAHHHSSITFHSRAFPSSQSKVRAFPQRLHASLWQQGDRVALSRPWLFHAGLVGKERALCYEQPSDLINHGFRMTFLIHLQNNFTIRGPKLYPFFSVCN